MLGTSPSGIQYNYDSPYFPQYRPAQMRELYFMGRRWVKRTEIAPYTRQDSDGNMVTVQGFHTTVWSADTMGMFAVKFTTREISAPRHPNR